MKIRFFLMIVISQLLTLSTRAGEGTEKAAIPPRKAPLWEVMTRSETGVDRFQIQHPEFTGKGVVIAILDTGVDMCAEGLRELPDGKVKVVDCRDFTGEGDVYWEEARLVPGGAKGNKLVDSKGRSLTGFGDIIKRAATQRFYIAFIEESKFSDTSVRDLNADGDTKDQFGILIFTVKDHNEKPGGKSEKLKTEKPGKVKTEKSEKVKANKAGGKATTGKDGGSIHYAGIVDINGDGNLADGIQFTDYWRKHQTFQLTGKKGGRRMLTMACNFFPAQKKLSIHFDAQGHGTHVAGISAGYKIDGQEGYNGMAPGARVISLKIGYNGFSGGATVTESVKKALDFGAGYSRDHNVPVVFNMSYGIIAEQGKQSAIDNYVNDILWKNPQIVFVTSAGNSGPGLSTIGTPGTAKRAITVGALLSPQAAPSQYGHDLKQEILFGFSSRGGDYFKPDIVAPGSASSTVPLWKDHDHANGTSMASPAATGSIAVLVDALVRNDPPLKIDNCLIHRAVKISARHIPGLTQLDEGGGALDIPAAYMYAKLLYERGEEKILREYRITNRGPGKGNETSYWRTSPLFPRADKPVRFNVKPGFPDGLSSEKKARFYRAFDLKSDSDWLKTTKPMIYLKGNMSASFGILADVTGKKPGLYTGKIMAFIKGSEEDAGAGEREFSVPVSVIVPYRVTPENRDNIQAQGEVTPGGIDRVFIEVSPGTKALLLKLRMLNGGWTADLNASVFDPEGIRRGGTGFVSGKTKIETTSTISGYDFIPGTWEIVVNSSDESKETACYELDASCAGVDFGKPVFFADTGEIIQKSFLVPLRSTQALPFSGTVSGSIQSFVKKNVMTVEKSDLFTRTIKVDKMVEQLTWNLEFDTNTYALFTDCVIKVEDVETGRNIRNTVLFDRTSRVSVSIPKTQSDPKKYRLVIHPAFTLKKDTKRWRFILSEELKLRSGGGPLEVVRPAGGRLRLSPWSCKDIEFKLPAGLPSAPAGYKLKVIMKANGGSWSAYRDFRI